MLILIFQILLFIKNMRYFLRRLKSGTYLVCFLFFKYQTIHTNQVFPLPTYIV